jgi:hypothetical protein
MRILIIVSAAFLFGAQTSDVQRQREERQKAYVRHGVVSRQDKSVAVTANEPRPLAQTVRALGDEYGWVIDFEDPPYYSKSDLVDDTAPEWRAAHPNEKGVTVVGGGAFQTKFLENADSTSAVEEEHVLETVVSDYNGSGNPGRFSVLNEGNGRFAVVGTHVHDDNGQDQAVTAILDTPVSVQTETRSADKTVRAILSDLSAKTHTNLGLGTIPMNIMLESNVTIGGQNIPARTLLAQTLSALDFKLFWHLYYDADTKMYFLNVGTVRKVAPAQAAN